jgi:hypothetical protein
MSRFTDFTDFQQDVRDIDRMRGKGDVEPTLRWGRAAHRRGSNGGADSRIDSRASSR